MTNKEKSELRKLAKSGESLEQIRNMTDCSDATIKRYIKIFNPTPTTKERR